MDASRASKPKARFAFKRTPTASRPTTPASTSSADNATGTGTGTGPGAGPSVAVGVGGEGGKGGKGAREKGKKDEGYTLSGRSGATLTAADIAPPLSPSGSERDITLTLSSLAHCLIDLRSCPLRNLHLDRLSSCLLLLPSSPVGVLAHRLASCVLSVPNCAQFRLHDSSSVLLSLGIQSYPVIEGCRSIYTMPAPFREEEVQVGGEGGEGGQGQGEGRWDKVQDFDSPTGASSNWRTLTSDEQATVKDGIRTSVESGSVEPALASIPS